MMNIFTAGDSKKLQKRFNLYKFRLVTLINVILGYSDEGG